MRATVRRSVLASLLVALGAQAHGADIGTLFHSAEQRAKMDRLRRGEAAAEVADATGVPRKPVVTGYVQRSDGRNTVWIDGHPVVLASPAAKDLLDPRIVQPQPQPADSAMRIEEHDGARGTGKRR